MFPTASWRTPAFAIFAGAVVLVLTNGLRQTFGLYLQPVSADMGWGREIFAFAIALQNLVWGVAQPFAGALADRYGAARCIAIAGLLYALGLMLMATSTTPLQLNIGAGFLVGFGLAGATFAVVLAAIARMVPPERRSYAFGICTALASLAQFAMLPIGQSFIEHYGWSVALLIFAGVSLLVVPFAAPLAGRSEAAQHQSLGAAVREAGGHSGYWLLTAGYFVCGFHVMFIGTHLPAYLVDRGLSPEIGAWTLALVGLFNAIGSFGFGVLGGTHRKKYLLAWIYLLRAVFIFAFIMVPLSGVSALLFGCAIGLMWLATVPLTTGLVGQIFGVQYLGMLSGFVFFSHQVGSFLGIWLGGWFFDRTGSYEVVWWIAIVLGLLAAALHYPIDDRALVRRPAAAAA